MTAYESWPYDPTTYTDHAPWPGQVAVDPEGRKWPVMKYRLVEYVKQVEHVGVPSYPRPGTRPLRGFGRVVDQSPGSVKAEPFRDYGPEKNRRARPLNPIRDDPREAEPYRARPQPEPSHPRPRTGPLGGFGQGGDQPPGVNYEDGLCTFDENRDKPRDRGGQKLVYWGPTAERYEQPGEYGIIRREKPSERYRFKDLDDVKPFGNFSSSSPSRRDRARADQKHADTITCEEAQKKYNGTKVT